MRHTRIGGLAEAMILGAAGTPHKSTGGFFMSNPAAAGVQNLSAIEMGTGTYVGGTDSIANYPNATEMKAVYKIATECEYIGGPVTDANRDLSKSVVMGEEMDLHPTWIAKNPTDGTNLHSFFGGGTSLFADLGNTGFQAQAATNVINFCSRWNTTTVYIDNMGGYSASLTFEGKIPQGYSSEQDWRYRAVIPFISYFCGQLQNHGIYVIMSAGDEFDASLGENVFDEHSMAAAKRYWTEIANRASYRPNAVFREYMLQSPQSPYNPYTTGEDSPNHRWTSNQSRIVDAHNLGFDFHGLAYHNAFAGNGQMCRFLRASMLLDIDQHRRDMVWYGFDFDTLAVATGDADLTRDPGGFALNTHQTTGTLHWRHFPAFTAIVNPTLASDTQTILGVSRTVAAQSAIFV